MEFCQKITKMLKKFLMHLTKKTFWKISGMLIASRRESMYFSMVPLIPVGFPTASFHQKKLYIWWTSASKRIIWTFWWMPPLERAHLGRSNNCLSCMCCASSSKYSSHKHIHTFANLFSIWIYFNVKQKSARLWPCFWIFWKKMFSNYQKQRRLRTTMRLPCVLHSWNSIRQRKW